METFNKKRDRDFPPGPEGDEMYDDYLENIEHMIMIWSDPNEDEKEKKKVRDEVKAERKNNQSMLNRKEENDDQLDWFKKIMKMHTNSCGIYTAYQMDGGEDVEMTNAQHEADSEHDDEVDSKRLKSLFETFNLDSYGKTGLEINQEGSQFSGNHENGG